MSTIKILGVPMGIEKEDRQKVARSIAAALRDAGIEFKHVASNDPWSGGQGMRDIWEDSETGEEVW